MPHPLTASRLPHTADQVLAAVTMGLAVLAVVLAVVGAYDAGAVIAALCVMAGGWSMYLSETLTERFETVTATVVGAVALMACLAYGTGLAF